MLQFYERIILQHHNILVLYHNIMKSIIMLTYQTYFIICVGVWLPYMIGTSCYIMVRLYEELIKLLYHIILHGGQLSEKKGEVLLRGVLPLRFCFSPRRKLCLSSSHLHSGSTCFPTQKVISRSRTSRSAAPFS